MTSASLFASHVPALIAAATIGAALLACDDSQFAGTDRQADSVSGDIVGDTLLDSSSDDDTGADAAVDGNPDVEIPVPDIDGSGDTDADIGVDVVGDDDVVFCGEDEDCPSALCYLPISSPDLGVCTALCTSDDNCPDDWRCVQDQSAGGDAVRICVPTDLCIDADQDGRGYGPGCIATDCDENDPTTYVGASELCDGLDNDCDDVVDEEPVDENDDCTTSFSGVCAPGRTRCIDGLFECQSNVAAGEEICDGLDNDCDGLIDEDASGETLRRTCYSGPEGTAGVGVCTEGVSTCADGRYTECTGAIVPDDEVCDGVDNNCDGEVDEGEPGAGAVCSTGLGGLCDISTTVCSDGELICPPTSGGRVEVCDGVDNDCDGDVDEDNPGGGGACGSGLLGICAAGVRACEVGTLVCNPTLSPAPEVCDGLDNDCDGATDEGNPGGGADCVTSGLGVCQAGRQVCASGALECQPIATASPELCDGLDNDCDGQVDEGNPGSGLACATGEPGLCGAGVTSCSEGGIICTTTVAPTTELCNGLDDDCDGTVDNGNPGGGRACGTGNPGVCSAGVTVCDEGGVQCEQTTSPSPEVCDGLDNNCNGATDEGNPGGGLSCSTGQAGICAAGTTACTGGSITCDRNNAPVSEICDSLDNDCDGSNNEQCPNGYLAGTGTTSPQWADLDGGSFFASTCPAGSYAVGFYGRAASRMDRVGTRCATMTFNTNTGTNPWSYSLDRGATSSATAYGGGGGTAFTRDCAAGTFMIGLAGRAGDRMDQMQALCGRFSITGSPGSYTVTRTQTASTATAGGSGGSPFSYLCPNNGVVSYILGRSGSEVDSAHVRCTELVPTLIAP